MNLGKSVDIFGKSVPIAMIALAVMAIPVAAATLEYFGSVDGTVDTQQAIVIGENEDAELDADLFSNLETVVGGEEYVALSDMEVENYQGTPYDLDFTTTLNDNDAEEGDEEVGSFDGTGADTISNDDVEVEVEYVNYFAEAGYEDPSYETSDMTGRDDFSEIEAGDEEVVITSDTLSTTEAITESNVEIYADGTTVEEEIEIEGDNVQLKGFEVSLDEGNGISIRGNDVVVEGNTVTTSADSNSDRGIRVLDYEGVEVTNNKVEGFTTGLTPNENVLQDLVVEGNTFTDNFAGIGSTDNLEGAIEYNVFTGNDEAIGVGDDQFETYGNRFVDNEASFRLYATGDGNVDAEDNFFYDTTYNIDYNGNSEDDVSVSYENFDSTVPEAESRDLEHGSINPSVEAFAMLADFDTYTESGDYEFHTEIK